MNAAIAKTTGVAGIYTKAYDTAGQVIIEAMIKRGEQVIYLRDLYYTLGADTAEKQNGVLWAVRHAKDRGDIANSSERGMYRVV